MEIRISQHLTEEASSESMQRSRSYSLRTSDSHQISTYHIVSLDHITLFRRLAQDAILAVVLEAVANCMYCISDLYNTTHSSGKQSSYHGCG